MRIGPVTLSLLVATALALTGNGLLSTLAAIWLADAGVPDAVSGWVLGSYFAGLLIGTLGLTPTINRIGSIRAFAAFTALCVTSSLAHGLVAPGWAWAPLRALTGLAMAGIYMTVESWLNAEASRENRGRVMAAYLVALYLGGGLGQLLLPILPEAGTEGLLVAAMAASIAAVVVSLARLREPKLQQWEPLPSARVIRLAPLGWMGAWVSGFLAGTIYTVVPLAARAEGLSTSEVSALMASYVLGGLAGQWPIGGLSDWMDRRAVLLLVAGTLSICCFAGPSLAGSLSARCMLAFGFGALAFSIYPLAVAHTLDRVGPEQSLPAASQMLLASSVGAVLGPIVWSATSESFSGDAFYAINGLTLAVFALVAGVRLVGVEAPTQDHFVAVPRTTPAVHDLDPRTDLGASSSSVPSKRWEDRLMTAFPLPVQAPPTREGESK